MDWVENGPSAGRQVSNSLADFLTDPIRRAQVQDALRITATAPERQVFPIFFLQPGSIHPRCRHLHRVDDIDTDFNPIWEEGFDGTTTVVEDPGMGFRLYGLDNAGPAAGLITLR